jgi:hypothetical protein
MVDLTLRDTTQGIAQGWRQQAHWGIPQHASNATPLHDRLLLVKSTYGFTTYTTCEKGCCQQNRNCLPKPCHALAVLLLSDAGTALKALLTCLQRVRGDKSNEAPYASRNALDRCP